MAQFKTEGFRTRLDVKENKGFVDPALSKGWVDNTLERDDIAWASGGQGMYVNLELLLNRRIEDELFEISAESGHLIRGRVNAEKGFTGFDSEITTIHLECPEQRYETQDEKKAIEARCEQHQAFASYVLAECMAKAGQALEAFREAERAEGAARVRVASAKASL